MKVALQDLHKSGTTAKELQEGFKKFFADNFDPKQHGIGTS